MKPPVPAPGTQTAKPAVQLTPKPPARFFLGRKAWAVALAIVGLVAALNFGAWRLLNGTVAAPEHLGPVAGLSYNGSGRWLSPLEGHRPAADELAQDLALLARHTRSIRSYSAADQAALPALAHGHGLELVLGAWLDDDLGNNQRELAAAIDQARTHKHIRRVIVGNETQLKGKLPPNRLTAYLDEARLALRGSAVQVSTAEPWHVWLAQPQLAQHVDFIAIHVLPYWQGESIDTAVQTSLAQIERVKARFPGRTVLVAEIGWPSNGPPLGKARATAANQALFVRSFLHQAQALNLDYFLIEAFDQPWKMAVEGRAGAYWGLWDARRAPKFSLSGAAEADPVWRQKAGAASALGAALALPFLLVGARLQLTARFVLAVAAAATASMGVVLLSVPLAHYLTAFDVLGLALVLVALAFISATLLTQAFEFVERFWAGASQQQQPADHTPATAAATAAAATTAPAPFISVHLACANEPHRMVIQAVESLLALDWPAFEVVVVDNNTRSAPERQALAAWMANQQDTRLRFVQFETLPGFKAGALNQALALTHPAAQWIAVVDADYVVNPQWFAHVQAHLHDAQVGVVQAPQAHRQWAGRWFDRMMNWESDGFFRIGMHHRHVRNAIIQHGTMTLVRAAALQRLRWSEHCICEDTELGLRLLQAGYRAVYVDRVLGTGLLPADLAAYARQRKRWAQGAMQIFRQHARSLLGPSPLTLAQRYHFLAGWLPWLGDALHLLFTVVMIAFSLSMVYLPHRLEPPLLLFVAPLIAFFTARLLIGPLLYARCVPCTLPELLGAAVAGMGLSHRIACGVLQGLQSKPAHFEITRKAASSQALAAAGGGAETPMGDAAFVEPTCADTSYNGPALVRHIEQEVALLAGLVFCIALLALSRDASDTGRLGWMVVLSIQALPYGATVACRLIEDRRQITPAGRPALAPKSTD
jgi:exo-beta-1,3-glucanase (GH17 family)/cellulose synthase/poly-beta-1,6-N-acetylglucosamine synthase-like glycosyltransferase